MRWFTRFYDRRIVNVNVNIIVAGLLAMVITVGVMYLAERWGVIDFLADAMPVTRELIINALTFLVDLIADVAVYYCLHWVANHMPRRTARAPRPAYADISFIRDATLVQFERAVLSPLLYVIALGTQHAMLKGGFSIAISTAIGFCAGIAVVRCLHTAWMIRNERRAVRGGTDIIAASPLVEHAISWMMPKPQTPGDRAESDELRLRIPSGEAQVHQHPAGTTPATPAAHPGTATSDNGSRRADAARPGAAAPGNSDRDGAG